MKTMQRTAFVLVMVVIATLLPGVARAQGVIPGCSPGVLPDVLPHGAFSLICVPAPGHWNGQLIVFAHGYVEASEPPTFSDLYLANGDGTYTFLPTLVQSLGYAFATTTYRQNGLAILEGLQDVRDLVNAFPTTAGSAPSRTYVTGVSEGGLVATLLAERSPDLFAGAVAACGPIGSFQAQIDYFDDFRVLFDYFFPNIIPGSPINIPADVMTNWQTTYVPAITSALAARPDLALALMSVSHAAFDPANLATVVHTTLDVLWYNIFATNDARAKLGGNPYDNHLRTYAGSSDDALLNLTVERFNASPRARAALHRYATTGELNIPLVTLHTTLDDVVPFWQETLYATTVTPVGRGVFILQPVSRYGHCNFTTSEVLGSFLLAASLP